MGVKEKESGIGSTWAPMVGPTRTCGLISPDPGRSHISLINEKSRETADHEKVKEAVGKWTKNKQKETQTEEHFEWMERTAIREKEQQFER